MIPLRRCSVFAVALLLTPAFLAQQMQAQDKPSPKKPGSTWFVDRTLSVAPQQATVPALKYRLLPLSWELKEGNAVPIYLRLVHEQSDAARKYWTETPPTWNSMPVDKIPLEEARKFLQHHRYLLRQIEVGARRRTAEWNYTIDEPNPIGLLLPDAQNMRSYAPMLILQARVALAEGDFAAAVHHLETGFAVCRHIAEGPTLIHAVIAFAMASQFTSAVADLVERPHAPNLYWALTTLPHPLIDMRGSLGFEYQTIEKQFPELADLDRERTTEQWNGVLRRVRADLQGLFALPTEGGKQKVPEWFPKDCAPEDPAAKSPDLSEARKYVARTKGWTADKVAALPPAQVLLLFMVGTYHEDRDDWYRATYLPYPQARRIFDGAVKRLHEAPFSEAHVPARLLLPALNKVTSAQARVERNLAALQIIEALRMQAAAHDGELPAQLDEVTEVPLPNDLATGRPFEYRREGDTATLVSQVPDDPLANNGIRYRVTIRKK